MISFRLLSFVALLQYCWAQSYSNSTVSSASASASSYSSTATPFMNGSLAGDLPQWNIYVPGYLADGYSLLWDVHSTSGNFKLGSEAAYIISESGSVTNNVTLSGTNTRAVVYSTSTASVDDDEWLLFVIDTDAFAVGPYQFSCAVTTNDNTKYTLSATVEESVIKTAAPSPYINASLAEDGSPIFDIYFPAALQFASGVQMATSSPTSSNFLYTSATADINGVDVGSSTRFTISSTFFSINYKKTLVEDSWLHVRIYTSVVTAGTYYLTVTFPNTNQLGRSTATAYGSIEGIVSSSSDSSVPSTSSWLLGSTPVPCGSDSELFTLELDGSGTELDGYDVYVGSDYIFYMADSNETITAQIMANQSLLINNFIVGIGKNYLSLVSLSMSFITATPWSIVDGCLKLYGSDFHAVPSGSGNAWVLGSINAAAGRSDMREVKIKARGFDDNLLADYPNCGSSSSLFSSATSLASSSAMSYSSSSVGLTRSSSVSGYSDVSSSAEDSTEFSMSSAIPVSASLSASSGSSASSSTFLTSSQLSSTVSSSNPLSSSSSDSVYATGSISNGHPSFSIHVPLCLQPWSSVEVVGKNNHRYSFEEYSVIPELNISPVVFNTSEFDLIVEEADYKSPLDIVIDGVATNTPPYVFEGSVIVNEKGQILKRDVLSFDVSYTITQSAEISSVGALSASAFSVSSTSVSVSTYVSSSSSSIATGDLSLSYENDSSSSAVYESLQSNVSTITTSQNYSSTTVLTITSCLSHSCHSETFTTGVTIVTSTVFGELTTLTTFCPLSPPTVTLTSAFDVSSNSLNSTPKVATDSSDTLTLHTVSIHGTEVTFEDGHISSRYVVTPSSSKAGVTSTEFLKTTTTIITASCSSSYCSTYLLTTSTIYYSSNTGLTSTESLAKTAASSGGSLKTSASASFSQASASISEFAGQANKVLGTGLFGLLLLGLVM